MAVGRPAPTSRAKVGPGQHRHRAPVAQHLARHLVRQQAGVALEALGGPGDAHLGRPAAAPAASAGRESHGWARPPARRCTPASAIARSADDLQGVGECRVRAGSAHCARELRICASCCASRPHRRVGLPARANWMASAVPQEPAPSTAIGVCAACSCTRPAQPEVRCVAWSSSATDCACAPRYSASKFTGGSSSCGKPPCDHQLRHHRARVREQHARADAGDGALGVLLGEVLHHEQRRPASLPPGTASCRSAWPTR